MKKGFTLIELLGVLILLAVIALITFPIIDKVLSNAKNEAYERQKDSIIEAARLYVTTNGNYSTSQTQLNFQTLIDAGFLKEGEILDPRDSNKEMPGCIVYNWSESKNQYIFEYSEDCVVATPAECFTYEDITLVESFDINYDECMTYMTNLDWEYSTDEIDSFCKGNLVDGADFNFVIEVYDLDTNELKSNNVITNVVETGGIAITNYDNSCGGFDVTIPKTINGKKVFTIANKAFAQKGLTSVSFPESIIAINEQAFTQNQLTTLNLSNLVNIEYISWVAFDCNPISDFVGIYEYNYDYFDFTCPM